MREYIEGTTVSKKYDLRVGATDLELETILKLIKDYNIYNFVEVGIHEGGLTEYLLETKCRYLGIEINEGIVRQEIKYEIQELGMETIYADCMEDSTITKVEEFLFINSGKSLIYCDNGNKKEEIKVYYKLARFGDIILTHDFSDGKRKVRGIRDYSYPEVIQKDIEFMEENPLFERLPEELLKETRLIGWIKIKDG
jgi:hypothetical protein